MIHLCLVITVHSTYRIKQASQQITFDVIHFSSILPKTAQYILNMRTIQFQKLRFYEIHWILLSRNRHGCLVGNHSLQNQVKDSLYSILLGLRCNKASYSIFSLIISEYAWYSSIPSIASSFSSVIDKITSFVNAVYQHKNNTPDI